MLVLVDDRCLDSAPRPRGSNSRGHPILSQQIFETEFLFMAVPFGVSIGDFIAVGSLTHQIITALSDSRGSKAEYKDLISLLSSLKWALQAVSGQFFELASSEGVDAAFGNGLKHQLGLCTKTMEDFLLSSQKYTESLLPDDRKKNFRKEFRKITWCLFKKEDVQQLYSTLQGHIQAFIMLMNAVTG